MPKILIIEDEKILGEMYKEKFSKADFDVVLADSAEKAKEILEEDKPDLILLDILLPRANGIAFLTEMKKKGNISSVPVIAFSNFDDPETKKEALRLGAKDYLIKTNFTPNEIVERIKNYLAQ